MKTRALGSAAATRYQWTAARRALSGTRTLTFQGGLQGCLSSATLDSRRSSLQTTSLRARALNRFAQTSYILHFPRISTSRPLLGSSPTTCLKSWKLPTISRRETLIPKGGRPNEYPCRRPPVRAQEASGKENLGPSKREESLPLSLMNLEHSELLRVHLAT